MKKKRILSAALALLLVASLSVTAFAADWNIADGDITVNAGSGGQTVTQETKVNIPDSAPVITGSSTTNTVTIKADAGQTANVTLKDVNIDVSGTGSWGTGSGSAAVSAEGAGDVTIELDGGNTVRSGYGRAGLEKNNTGSLTITDANNDSGSLDAAGGEYGAGIGGGYGGDGSNITITGSAVDAKGGDYGAGIGGGSGGSGSDITVTDADVTATGGWLGAGIGGGAQGSGSNITLSGSKVDAQGGVYGAGIGGGDGGSGSNITITGSAVDAKGGYYGAGIGGGTQGSGSGITITGSAVDAQGGNLGAGIGGGSGGSGSNITFTGSTVDAQGGAYGAGVGGGVGADGSDITVIGGKTKAAGGDGGAGIGGGRGADGSGITVSGDAQVKVQGGEESHGNFGTRIGAGAGAAIGNGGDVELDWDTYTETLMRGEEATPDVSRLTAKGKIEYYAPGADMEKDAPAKTIEGTYVPDDEIAADTQSAPLYRVLDKDEKDIAYEAEQKDGVLTVTVDADFAVLTGKLSGISTLRAQGVEKLVFVTKGATSTFVLADLLEKGSADETYKLTHDGETVTFTLGVKNTDVREILEKA